MSHPWKKGRGVAATRVSTLGLALLWLALNANAQTSVAPNERAANRADTSAKPVRTLDMGQATRSWLALQRSNAAAAPALPTPGAQATLAYERYMNSFRTRIPASFGSTLSEGSDASRQGEVNDGSGAAPAAATR